MAIHIKASKVGSLHTLLGVSQKSTIPADKLPVKPGDSPVMRKKKNFAINAQKWSHSGPPSLKKLMG